MAGFENSGACLSETLHSPLLPSLTKNGHTNTFPGTEYLCRYKGSNPSFSLWVFICLFPYWALPVSSHASLLHIPLRCPGSGRYGLCLGHEQVRRLLCAALPCHTGLCAGTRCVHVYGYESTCLLAHQPVSSDLLALVSLCEVYLLTLSHSQCSHGESMPVSRALAVLTDVETPRSLPRGDLFLIWSSPFPSS